jgi:malate dehydrogenase (oxaloacetate-decarboxylating)
VAGAFNQAVVAAMARYCPSPLILPLSNPTSLAEATPAHLLAWTDGHALVATGSPFGPVTRPEGLREIGQCNNCFLFPGLGFATVAVGLRGISDGMIDAGLEALAQMIPASSDPKAPLMPALSDAAAVGAAVAEAVALAGIREGLAPEGVKEDAVKGLLERARWTPHYQNRTMSMDSV